MWVCGLPGAGVWVCAVCDCIGQCVVGVWCMVLWSVGVLYVGLCTVGAPEHSGVNNTLQKIGILSMLIAGAGFLFIVC